MFRLCIRYGANITSLIKYFFLRRIRFVRDGPAMPAGTVRLIAETLPNITQRHIVSCLLNSDLHKHDRRKSVLDGMFSPCCLDTSGAVVWLLGWNLK